MKNKNTMHSIGTIDFESFYGKLHQLFPELKRNPVWNEWDWSNESCEQCVVISEVAKEMIEWAANGNWQHVEALLQEVEIAFVKGTDPVIAYLGTDFTFTIMECDNSEIRKRIRQLMGATTFTAYQMNLRGYGER